MTRSTVVRPRLAGRVVGLGLGRVAWVGAGVGLLLCGVALAGPEGEVVRHGQATFNRQGATTTIRASDRAIIDYGSFNIASHETVRFVQPSSQARVLNRVQGADPTRIDGSLMANGRVYIVNPAGVYFGEGALVNVGGIYAAAAHMSDLDFLRGVDRFTNARGDVVNRGTIIAGEAVLFGRHVTNAGLIVAERGMVTLAAGEDVLVGREDGHVFARFSGGNAPDASGTGVVNSGQIRAERGEVVFGAGDVFAMAVDLPGAVRAARIQARADRGTVTATGTLDASSTTPGEAGGRVELLGERVGLAGATIDASGPAGGGTVLVGGDFRGTGPSTAERTYVGKGTSIRADATGHGDGGKVVVWGDQWTRFSGSISARGGETGGDGGLVEVSGKEYLTFLGDVDTGAPRGGVGSLLLDPATLTIIDDVSGSGDHDTDLITNLPLGQVLAADPDVGANEVSWGAIDSLAATTDVILEATGLITINDVTGNAGGTITANNLVSLDLTTGSLRITSTGGSVTFADTSDVIRTEGGYITIEGLGAASVLTIGGLNTSGSLGNTSGNITLTAGQTLTVSGTLTSGGGDVALTADGTGTATNLTTATINAGGGNVTLSANRGISIGGGVSTTGTGVFSADGDADSNGAGSVTQQAGTTLSTGGGNVVLSAGQNITLRAVDTGGGSLTATADADGNGTGNFRQFTNQTADTGGGDMTITAATIQVDGTLDVGAGDAVLRPRGTAATVGVGDGTAGTFQLQDSELTNINGTGVLAIGYTDGTGTGAVDIDPPDLSAEGYGLSIGGGTMSVASITLGAADLTLVSSDVMTLGAGAALAAGGAGRTITLRADDLDLSAATSISAPGGQVDLLPTAAGTIALGAGAGGTFVLDAAELAIIAAADAVTIGEAASGAVEIDAFDLSAETYDLSIVTGADIQETTTNAVTDLEHGGALSLTAATGIGGTGANEALDIEVAGVVNASSAANEIVLAAAAGDIILGAISSPAGADISITAAAGAIYDDNSGGTRVTTAGAVTLGASTGIGQEGGPVGTGSSLDLDVGTVTAAASATGGIAVRLIDGDAGGVTVTSADASTSGDIALTADAGSGTVTIISLDANDGGVTVDTNNADVSITSITADSGAGTTGTNTVVVTDAGAVTIDGSVMTDRGSIAVGGSGDVLLTGAAAGLRVQDQATGTITVTADDDADDAGDFAVDNALGSLRTAGGAVAVTSADISLTGSIDAGTGQVTLQPSTDTRLVGVGAASQFALSDAEAGMITAQTLVVGRATSTASITVGTLDLSGDAASLTLRTTGAVVESATNTTTDLTVDGTLTFSGVGGVGGSGADEELDVVAGLLAATATGDVFIRSSADLTLGLIDAGTSGATLRSTGSILDGNGAANNVVADALTLSAGADIGDLGGNDPLDVEIVSLTAASTGAGDIDILENGTVTLVSLTTANGSIRVQADSVLVDLIQAAGAGNAVSISATAGSITEADNDPEADAEGQAVTLTAFANIRGEAAGTSLEVAADTLDVSSTDAGTPHAVRLAESDTVDLTDVDVANGSAVVTAGGALTATDVSAAGGSIVLTGASVAVGLVQATGAGNDVSITATAGAITEAGADAGADILGSGLTLTAVSGIGDADAIETDAATISAVATASGNVRLADAASVALTLVSSTEAAVISAVGTLTAQGVGAATVALSADTVAVPGTVVAGGDATLTGATAATVAGTADAGGALLLDAPAITVSGTLEGDTSATLRGSGVGAGSITVSAGADVTPEGSLTFEDTLGLTIGQAVTAGTALTIDDVGTANVNASAGAGTTLTISDTATVNLAADTGLSAGGNLSAETGVTVINLTGGSGTTNTISTTGDGDIALAPVAAGSGADLVVSAEGSATLAGATLTGIVDGDLTVTVDADDDGAESLTAGTLAAAALTAQGGSAANLNDMLTFNGQVTTTGAAILRQAGTIDINRSVTSTTSLTISDAAAVDLAQQVNLTAQNGALSAGEPQNVGSIVLSGAAGTNTLASRGAGAGLGLAPITATGGAGLRGSSDGGATVASVAITSGVTLEADFDNNTAGAALVAGPLSGSDVILRGGATRDDTATLTGDVAASGAGGIDARNFIAVNLGTGTDLSAATGGVGLRTGVTQVNLTGTGTNTISTGAAGDGGVSLAPVSGTAGLTVSAAGSATLGNIDIDGPLAATVDADNDGTATLTAGSATAAGVTFSGGSAATRNDTLILGGAIRAEGGAVLFRRAGTVDVNRSAQASGGLTIRDAVSVDLAPGVSLTADAGNVSAYLNVDGITLSGGGVNRVTASNNAVLADVSAAASSLFVTAGNDATLADLNSTSGPFLVTAGRDATLAGNVASTSGDLTIASGRHTSTEAIDLNTGDLSICFDSDGSGDGILTLGPVTSAASVTVACLTEGPPSGGDAVLTGNVSGSGDILFAVPVILMPSLGDSIAVTSTAGDVTFQSTIDADAAANTRHLTIDGGAVTLAGSVGGEDAPDNLTIRNRAGFTLGAPSAIDGDMLCEGAGDSTLDGAFSVGGDFTQAGAGDLTVNRDLSVGDDFFQGGTGALVLNDDATAVGDFRQESSGPVTLNSTVFAGDFAHFASPVTLAGNASIRGDSVGVTLESNVNGAFDLTLASAAGLITVAGDFGNSTPPTDLRFDGNTRLAGSISVSAATLAFNGTVQATAVDRTLTIETTGGTTLNDDVGGGPAALGAVSIAGPLLIAGVATTSVTTDGPQSYTGPVTLATDAALNAGAGAVTLASAVDGGFDLAVTAGTAFLGASLGATTPLDALTFDAPVVLNTDVSVAAAEIQFNMAVDAAAAGIDLATSGGGVYFDGDVGRTQGRVAPDTITATGSINFGTAVPVTIRTVGAQRWNGDVSVGSDTTFESTAFASVPPAGERIVFADNVTGSGAAVTINELEGTRFAGPVVVRQLTTDAGGVTVIAGGLVETVAGQTYGDAVRVEGDATLRGGDATFASSLTADAGLGIEANVAAQGPITVAGALTVPTAPMNGYTVSSAGQAAAGNISVGSLTTNGGLTLSAPDAQEIRIAGDATGPGSLIVNTGGVSRFLGEIAVNTVATDTPGTTQVTDPTVTTVGTQTWRDRVEVAASTRFESTDGSLVFEGGLGTQAGAGAPSDITLAAGQSVTLAAGGLDGSKEIDKASAAGIGTDGTIASIRVVAVDGRDAPTAFVGGGIRAVGSTVVFSGPVIVMEDCTIQDEGDTGIRFLSTIDGTSPAPELRLRVKAQPAAGGNQQPFEGDIATTGFGGDVGATSPLGLLDLAAADNQARSEPPAAATAFFASESVLGLVAAGMDALAAAMNETFQIRVEDGFRMAALEKLTALGSLEINAPMGTVVLGDVTALADLTVTAGAINLALRESGPLAVRNFDNSGLVTVVSGEGTESDDNSASDLVAGRSVTLSQTPGFIGAGLEPRFGTDDGSNIQTNLNAPQITEVDPDIASGPGVERLLFDNGAADPLQRFVFLDVKAGQTVNNPATSLAGALPRERESIDIANETGSVLSVAKELEQIGILLDEDGAADLQRALGVSLYEDLRFPLGVPHGGEPRAPYLAEGREVYYKPTRLSGERALDLRDSIQTLYMFKDGKASPISAPSDVMNKAWDAYVDSLGGADPAFGGFTAFVRQAEPGGDAARLVGALLDIFARLDGLGLTPFELEKVRLHVLKDISPGKEQDFLKIFADALGVNPV